MGRLFLADVASVLAVCACVRVPPCGDTPQDIRPLTVHATSPVAATIGQVAEHDPRPPRRGCCKQVAGKPVLRTCVVSLTGGLGLYGWGSVGWGVSASVAVGMWLGVCGWGGVAWGVWASVAVGMLLWECGWGTVAWGVWLGQHGWESVGGEVWLGVCGRVVLRECVVVGMCQGECSCGDVAVGV
jgi:hypothetical protein